MPPVISIVGRAKSGKTTLLEKIIIELNLRGYSVATMKHTTHTVDIDKPGKDTWRHLHAGSKATTLIASNNIVLIKPSDENFSLNDIVRMYGEDFDIVLVEGFKQSPYPKIEVHRKIVGPILSNISNIIAYATDESLETDVKQFALDNSKHIVDFIETGYIKTASDRITFYINDTAVHSNKISDKSLKSLVTTITASIKDNRAIDKLSIFFKRQH